MKYGPPVLYRFTRSVNLTQRRSYSGHSAQNQRYSEYTAHSQPSNIYNNFFTYFGFRGSVLRVIEHPGFYNFSGMLEAMHGLNLTSGLAMLLANSKYIQTDPHSLIQLYKALNLDNYSFLELEDLKSVCKPGQTRLERFQKRRSFYPLNPDESLKEVEYLSNQIAEHIRQTKQNKYGVTLDDDCLNKKKTGMKN